MNKQNGFTLLEIIISVGISAILIVTLTSFLTYSSSENKDVLTKYRVEKSGRMTAEFIKTFIEKHDEFRITKKSDGQLDNLIIYKEGIIAPSEVYVLRYSADVLSFGGKSDSGTTYTSKYMDNIKYLSVENMDDLFYITVIVKDEEDIAQSEFTSVISTRYKKIYE